MKKVHLLLILFSLIVSCVPAVTQTKPYAPEVKLNVPFEPNLGDTCFSSSFAMVMRYWGKDVHVDDIIKIVGHPPFNNSTLTQLNGWMKKNHDLTFKYLPNSSIKQVKLFLNENYPVIVNQTFSLNDNTGHSRVVTGYNDKAGIFIVNDPSLPGPNYAISYINFRELWWKISLNQNASSYVVYLIIPIKQ